MARDGGHGRLIEALRWGEAPEAVARALGLPVSAVEATRTFYDQLHGAPGAPTCVGTACWSSRPSETPPPEGPTTQCLGRCYEGPARGPDPAPIPRASLVESPVVLRHLLGGAPAGLAEYELPDADAILEAVEAADLRGRGGSAYPTAAKWRTARGIAADERYVVANGDEGDPGAYVDRLLLEEDPHAVLAGMVACAKAIGARRGFVFIRGEYGRAPERVRAAIAEARAAGHLGAHFDVEVVRGAGSYVAGEETALLAALEGRRAEPRPKPPYPSEVGLRGRPTVVQNVETLAVVPWVVRHRRRTGTKAICLAGAVRRPGVVEVALGTPLCRVLEEAGGGAPDGRPWKMALVGGPMGRVLPARAFEQPLGYDTLPGLGHGGVVVLDASFSARALAEHLFAFARAESCGSCTPCRVGTSQLAHCEDRPTLSRLLDTLEMGSLCGFGAGVPRPLRDLLAEFPEELFP